MARKIPFAFMRLQRTLSSELVTGLLGLVFVALLIANIAFMPAWSGEASTFETQLSDPAAAHNDTQWGQIRSIVNSSHHVDRAQMPSAIEESDKYAGIAYFIQISEQNSALLPGLMERLWHPAHIYVLHFDLKMAEEKVRIFKLEFQSEYGGSNIWYLPRERIIYRGITMTTNTVSAMMFMYNLPRPWSYFINLSASDYPMVNPQQQWELLSRARSKPLFFSLMMDSVKHFYRYRVGTVHVDPALYFANHTTNLFLYVTQNGMPTYFNPLTNEADFEFMKAEAWMMIPRDFVEYILFSSFPRKLLAFLTNSCSSPEHFFITCAHEHAGFQKRLVNRAFRTVIWVHNRRHSGQHPYDLDTDDREPLLFWEEIYNAKGFFARKFTRHDSPIRRKIDAECLGTDGSQKNVTYFDSVRAKMASLVEDFEDFAPLAQNGTGAKS